MINNYENIIILKGSLTDEEVKKELEKIKKYYFKNTEVYEKENEQNGYLGKKKLAYNIGNETEGYYYLTHFRTNIKEIGHIEFKMKKNNNIIKFITVKVED